MIGHRQFHNEQVKEGYMQVSPISFMEDERSPLYENSTWEHFLARSEICESWNYFGEQFFLDHWMRVMRHFIVQSLLLYSRGLLQDISINKVELNGNIIGVGLNRIRSWRE